MNNGQAQSFLGHNPLGRITVSAMILLMVVLMSTGWIRAGTDIYYPPFGAFVAEYVVDDNTDPKSLIPNVSKGTLKDKVNKLKNHLVLYIYIPRIH